MVDEWKKKMQALIDGANGGAPKRNYLLPGGYQEKNDLLAGIGGPPLPNYRPPAEEEREQTDASETDAALDKALGALANGLLAGSHASESETALRAEADNRLHTADTLRQTASARGDALYDTLLAFADKQDGRYEALLSQITQKGYRDFAGVDDILAAYAAEGDRAAGYAAANGAADNGGNPDSYAAAQAARKRLDFTQAGTETALSYYNDQLDRWLSTLAAAGGDAAALYELMQENVDSTHDAASEEAATGEGMFSALLDAENSRAETNADLFSSLLSRDTAIKQAASGETSSSAVSPMQIDREYDLLINGNESNGTKYTPQNALIVLWKKYPTMRDYLMEKYQSILNPSYTFGEE